MTVNDLNIGDLLWIDNYLCKLVSKSANGCTFEFVSKEDLEEFLRLYIEASQSDKKFDEISS